MVKEEKFGLLEEQQVTLLTIQNDRMKVEMLDYGATIRAIWVQDRDGNLVDVCLGYDSIEDYRNQDGYLGATVGRNANRIANASIVLNGKEYYLTENEGGNQLHGGLNGFDRKVWAYSLEKNGVTFSLDSADGEEGFPGNLRVKVTYALEGDALKIDYRAASDQDTVVNLTNHAYFNLGGHNSGEVTDHELTVCAGNYTPVDGKLIPTGEIAAVEGTALDLRAGAVLGACFENPALASTNGYDHNFVLDDGEKLAAVLYCPKTGIRLETRTSLEGIQVYTAGALTERKGKNGAAYGYHYAVCLETQHFPDAIHHANFPTPVLKAGQEYHETTEYRFSVK